MPSLGIAPCPGGCVGKSGIPSQGTAPVQTSFRWMAACIDWRLGFKQFSFHHIPRVPRHPAPVRLGTATAFLACSGPLHLSDPGKPSDPGTSLRVPPDRHPRPPAHRSTAPAKTPPRPTAGPPIAIGQSARLLGTVNATVYDFRQPSVTGGPSAGPAGYTWASADVQVCTLDSAKQTVTVDWKTWGLHYADNSLAVAADANNDAFPR